MTKKPAPPEDAMPAAVLPAAGGCNIRVGADLRPDPQEAPAGPAPDPAPDPAAAQAPPAGAAGED